MHGKSKAEKDDAMKSIKDMLLASETAKVIAEGKCGIFFTHNEMFLDIFLFVPSIRILVILLWY